MFFKLMQRIIDNIPLTIEHSLNQALCSSLQMYLLQKLNIGSPDASERLGLLLAEDPEIVKEREMWKGAYVVPYGVREEPSEDARRDDLARELWETTEMVLEKFGWA